MIEVNRDGNVAQTQGCFDEFFQVNRMCILPRTFGDLEHDRRLFLFAGLHDGLEQLHIVDVERADGVFAPERLGKEFSGVGQWHKFSVRFDSH